MNTTILILDLAKSKIENSFKDIIKSINDLTIYTINDPNELGENFLIKPELIFIVLNSCCKEMEKLKIEKINSFYPFVPKIGMFENDSICTDCEGLRRFIWNFFVYPFRKEEIILTINWYMKGQPLLNQNFQDIYSSLKKHAAFDLFKGESIKSIEIKEKILKIAQFDVTVLIKGETGTGKELCAKMIHFLSKRAKNSFVPVNCGAIPAELFENELFGHKKGAYTNAESNESGLVAEANNGTLFLDEIESIPELMQVKLLRFLEDKKFKPLGQSQYINSNVRIIAAAKENLWDRVKRSRFREDLFYRLNVLNLNLPPLRERQQDIPLLVSFFVNRFSKLYSKDVKNVEPFAMMKILHHEWEGNIRELQNVIQEAVIMNSTGFINENDLNLNGDSNEKFRPLTPFKHAKEISITEFEKSYLSNLLSSFNGNLTKASNFAKKDRRALGRLIKKYKVDPSLYRKKSNNM